MSVAQAIAAEPSEAHLRMLFRLLPAEPRWIGSDFKGRPIMSRHIWPRRREVMGRIFKISGRDYGTRQKVETADWTVEYQTRSHHRSLTKANTQTKPGQDQDHQPDYHHSHMSRATFQCG